MAAITQISNGQVVGNKATDVVESQSAEENSKTTKSTSKTQQTKDMFMQLLVAQMKYQNPLEPTDNTEYVREMASFSQVEAMENMSDSFEKMSGNSLVGLYATATDKDGVEHTGKVEYSFKKDGSTWLHIGDDDYSIDNVTGVKDSDYFTATTIKDTIDKELSKLPSPTQLTIGDTETVYNIQKVYNSLTSYQQSFIPESTVKIIEALVNRADVLTGKTKTKTDDTASNAVATTAETADASDKDQVEDVSDTNAEDA
ncbi:MAG: flagellar hook capping FlgD N-terminal domain-containing protein [Lachnospiraceae bacterium]|nr:flagellar hook capping FlgD N-terminal domain-containing protein [Lachnospiraceae bacterium]